MKTAQQRRVLHRSIGPSGRPIASASSCGPENERPQVFKLNSANSLFDCPGPEPVLAKTTVFHWHCENLRTDGEGSRLHGEHARHPNIVQLHQRVLVRPELPIIPACIVTLQHYNITTL